jgi:hypothetical protein
MVGISDFPENPSLQSTNETRKVIESSSDVMYVHRSSTLKVLRIAITLQIKAGSLNNNLNRKLKVYNIISNSYVFMAPCGSWQDSSENSSARGGLLWQGQVLGFDFPKSSQLHIKHDSKGL